MIAQQKKVLTAVASLTKSTIVAAGGMTYFEGGRRLCLAPPVNDSILIRF